MTNNASFLAARYSKTVSCFWSAQLKPLTKLGYSLGNTTYQTYFTLSMLASLIDFLTFTASFNAPRSSSSWGGPGLSKEELEMGIAPGA